ncbi:hypothetical protein PR048_029334 [Dryococelus australis]|uniref:C2H2-type domain-containing protein n=1 Tax=Dryococelus australis TaxID=614101 RepID=A0ABQ9GFR5_9NEOP|nr:hypothetical protein PR048_029334 [Dryococelus australis]
MQCRNGCSPIQGNPLIIYEVAEICGKAYLLAFTPQNIVIGFEKHESTQKNALQKEIEMQSSDSERFTELREDLNRSLAENIEEERLYEDNAVGKGDFVLVKLARKRRTVCYIAEVIDATREEIHHISADDIQMKLPHPICVGGSRRQVSQLSFCVDFITYDVNVHSFVLASDVRTYISPTIAGTVLRQQPRYWVVERLGHRARAHVPSLCTLLRASMHITNKLPEFYSEQGAPSHPPLKLVESGNTKKQSFMCVSCNKYYISVSNLQRSRDGTGIEYHCTMCPLVFNFEKSFCKHLKLHSVKHILFCQQCKDMFGNKRFFCYVCKHEFPNRTQFESHQKLHKEEPLTCVICTRRFENESCLNEHKKICSNPKYCGVERKNFQGLSWQRLFRCDLCQEQFITQKMLIEHKTNCNETRPKPKYFECGVCGNNFLTSEDLTAHKLSHNAQMASFACDSCGLKFFTAGGLASHKISHGKKYTSCSPTNKKEVLSEPESNSNESVPQLSQQVTNSQEKQEVVTNDKKVSLSTTTAVKPDRPQKNSNRQRFLLPKAVRNRNSPVNTGMQNQPSSKSQLSMTYNSNSTLQQQNPKIPHPQYQQLPGSRIIQHQFMPAGPIFQPQILPGSCIPQDISQNQHVPPNSVTQHEQFVNMNQQQPPASSIVPCDIVSSNDETKHQQISANNNIQYQPVSTNNAGQYQMPSDVAHSHQQVGTSYSFQHHVSTSTDLCQETEGGNSDHHQQSSVYSNVQNHVMNNSFHNQQNINATNYNNMSVHATSLPQHLSTNNTNNTATHMPVGNAVGNNQQLTNPTAQNQQWPIGSTHMSTNTNQFQVLSQNNGDHFQQHSPTASTQQTLISINNSENQNSPIPQHQQIAQVLQQQLVCNSIDQQQSDDGATQNPQFLSNDATYQLLSANSVQQQVQTSDALENEQTVINSAQNQQMVIAENQQGTNIIQNQHLTSLQNQVQNNSSARSSPLIINSSIQQQLISNSDNSQVQNQSFQSTGAQTQHLFDSNFAQNQQLAENNVINNQHLYENDTAEKQHSPENNDLQSQQISENNSQSNRLSENISAQSQQLAEINVSQKEIQSYDQQMLAEAAVHNQQLFANGMPHNQHFAVNQHSTNGVLHSQQPVMCFPFQHQTFPANVVILQPHLPENAAFHQVTPNVSHQQQFQANNVQQQNLQQQKMPNSMYSHQLLPASFMYQIPANNSLAHFPQLPQNITNHHLLPANMVYQLQPSLATNFSGQQVPQGVVTPSQVLPANCVPQQVPGYLSSQNQFPGIVPQNQQVAGGVTGSQVLPAGMLPNYHQVVLANNTAPHQILLPNGLSQHQQFAVGGYPQSRLLLPNIAPQQLASMKQDSNMPEKDPCCDICCEEHKSGSGLCHHGKRFKRSESSNIINTSSISIDMRNMLPTVQATGTYKQFLLTWKIRNPTGTPPPPTSQTMLETYKLPRPRARLSGSDEARSRIADRRILTPPRSGGRYTSPASCAGSILASTI